MQLLTLAKACNCFLMCAVLSVSLSKSIKYSKEGRGWKVGGTVTRLGGMLTDSLHDDGAFV